MGCNADSGSAKNIRRMQVLGTDDPDMLEVGNGMAVNEDRVRISTHVGHVGCTINGW